MFLFANAEAPKINRSRFCRHRPGQPHRSSSGHPLWQVKLYQNALDFRCRYDLIFHPYRRLISRITSLRIYRFLL